MNRPNIVFILSDDQGPWAAGLLANGPLLLTSRVKHGWQRKLRDLATPVETT